MPLGNEGKEFKVDGSMNGQKGGREEEEEEGRCTVGLTYSLA